MEELAHEGVREKGVKIVNTEHVCNVMLQITRCVFVQVGVWMGKRTIFFHIITLKIFQYLQ